MGEHLQTGRNRFAQHGLDFYSTGHSKQNGLKMESKKRFQSLQRKVDLNKKITLQLSFLFFSLVIFYFQESSKIFQSLPKIWFSIQTGAERDSATLPGHGGQVIDNPSTVLSSGEKMFYFYLPKQVYSKKPPRQIKEILMRY